MTRIALLLLAAAVLLFAGTAQAVDITFHVRMSEQILLGNFDPGVDSVDIAGTFNGWGQSPLTPLSDVDGDSTYSVVLGGFTAGEIIEYKFRLNGEWGGTEEFPGYGFNRVYTVLESGNVIDVWYNDFEPGDGEVEIGPTHWWNDTVFYEIFVRSFQDSDGDGIGDFQGLTQKLDYLNDGDPATTDDLGITGIWLMPIHASPSYHGYDATDYYSIHPEYGTMADFEAFLAAAHARGIKVIIDLVLNHSSNQHPWFQASAANDPAYRDWYRWSDDDPEQTGPWGENHQVWHWSNNDYYYGLFWDGMPDLNYETPAVKDEMFATATYWLDTVGVDGFRLDAILFIHETGDQMQNTPETFQFWQDFNTHVKSVTPTGFSVGEAWTASNTVVQYVEDDRLDICFEFDLSNALIGAANWGDADYLSLKADQVYNLYPYLQFGTFLTNHDQNRTFTVLGQNEGRNRVAAGLYMTLPGVPFVYYGEEIGMVGEKPDPDIRTPMQWTPGYQAGFTTGTPWRQVNGNFPQFNVQTEDADATSLLTWYRKLVHLRNDSPALRRGTHDPLGTSVSPVMAYIQRDSTQTLLCLANTADATQLGVTLTGLAGILAPGDYAVVDRLDPTDTPVLTVTEDHEITGVALNGHEVRVYEITGIAAVDEDPGDLPRTGLLLEQNHPNPFNPSTTIRYAMPERAHVKIGVYDVAGREVAVLEDSVKEKGPQQVRWLGVDDQGQSVGAGVYFLRLQAGTETRLTKMTLVK